MYSVGKKLDRELLQTIAETIQVFAKGKTVQALDAAELLGEDYVRLSERIATHDYSQEDRAHARVDAIMAKLK